MKDIYQLTYKDINELFYTGKLNESQTIELKRDFSFDKNGRIENREFVKDITAMANADGGYIFIGIDEKALEVCGITNTIGNQKIEDWICNVLNDLVDKSIEYQLNKIPVNEDSTKSVFVLNIAKGKNKPYYLVFDKKSLVYIRKGTSVFGAKPDDIANMYKSSLQNDEDNLNSKIEIKQSAKGKRVQQIGQNFGRIINTEKVQNVTEVLYDKESHISDQQAKQIKDKVDEIVSIHDKAGKFKTSDNKGKFYAVTWSSIKNRYGVTKYTLLRKEDFEDCMKWLQTQIASIHRPILRKHNNSEWKNSMYSSIYAKSRNEWNMDRQQLFKFVEEKLDLKKPITSLKDLSDVRLKKLYNILFST
ncbi:hypothetical protein CMU02_14810 [Elizabethkingia anophelis]|uniref:AlbA family DNA-binding domain-containing protein n=1 Tax=Elizabethkingia anophelis TaxID=1117645 RepID=UPI00293C5FCC|nr:hypothetical protein [Elizabethkingia anophelis]MDV3906064.1 hypothetical protein [Elizabethkingia anophelis]